MMETASWWWNVGVLMCLTLSIVLFIATFLLYRAQKKAREKKQSIELQIARKEYELLLADRKEYFTNIVSEINQPLTSIVGICNTLEDHIKTTSNQSLRPHIEKLSRNVKLLNEWAQETLNARHTDDDILGKLNIQSITVETIFQRWIYVYEEIAQQNNINLTIKIERADLNWCTDLTSLGKLITHLLSNAMKHTPGGGEVRVSTTLTPTGELRLEVYHTGSDNSKSNLIHQWKKLSDKLDAKMSVEGVEGQFTRITVDFPKMMMPTFGENEPDFLPTENIHQRVGKPRILVIDNNPDILWLVSDILSDEYAVSIAKDVAEARKLIKEHIPELIITDIMMPDENGLDFIKHIRENKFTRNLPVIIISGRNAEEDKIIGYNAGADAYITKPFNVDILKTLVSRLLQRKVTDTDYYRSPESTATLDSGKEITHESKMFIENMRKYIINNLNDESKLSAAALASAMNVDIRTLYRRFKKNTDFTPSEFVKNIRYSYAANLILSSTLTIQEIIYQVGMTNKTVFYSDFKKIYGMTPKEYRNSKH